MFHKGIANVVTPAGAWLYVDHAHPEYSAPENTEAYWACCWERAGDAIVHAAAQRNNTEHENTVKLYKNNTDGKGSSYGAHENYIIPRNVPLDTLHAALIPHFVTRQIYTGSGRVGLGQHSEKTGFQISQRADFIETDTSLETTLNRDIINTRDEPHADAQWRRLHVIFGDSLLSETALLLKVGSTALILRALVAGADFSALKLSDPLTAVCSVSYDTECTASLALTNGSESTAVGIQQAYIERIRAVLDPTQLSIYDRLVLELWENILRDLAIDPLLTKDRLDWSAKLSLIKDYCGDDFSNPKAAQIDLQYHDLDPAKGLYYTLVAHGVMNTIIEPEDTHAAMRTPPTSTRAWLRGRIIERFSDSVYAAN